MGWWMGIIEWSNVERPGFRNDKITNIKITNHELFFIFLYFLYFPKFNNLENLENLEKLSNTLSVRVI